MNIKKRAKEALKTTLDKYGLDENGKSIHHANAGSVGGKAKVKKGFSANRELARAAGRKGGKAKKTKLS